MALTGLADATGIALSTMYRWKESLPHNRTSKQIAEVLRVSEAWLREGIGEMESAVMREEPALYRVEPRAGKGSQTGVNPQPETSSEMLAACHLFLRNFGTIDSRDALHWAVTSMHYAIDQYRDLKLKELQS